MAKDTYYFSHDYNCRSDIKIRQLIRNHGMEGYGIYWAIVEDLYNNSNILPNDPSAISFDLRSDTDKVKSIINDFGLFIVSNDSFGSMSIQKRIDERDKKSNNAMVSAKSRWGDNDARIKAEDTIFYILEIFSEDERFIKAGITSESVSRRYSGKLNGYNYTLLFQQDFSCENVIKIEREVNGKFAKYKPQKSFPGYLECFDYSEKQSIMDFAMRNKTFRSAKKEFRNAIKESKGKESKEKENKGGVGEKLKGRKFDTSKTFVIFQDGSKQKLGTNQLHAISENKLQAKDVTKGIIY